MATQQLVLLRHAKSDWHSGVQRDFDRPLNRRGRLAAPAMGDWFTENEIRPDIILCSPAERTRETIALVSERCQWSDIELAFVPSLYHASLQDLLQSIESGLDDHRSIMLVGHNPGLELLLLHCFPETPSFPDGKFMPTATAAVMEMVNGVPSALLHLKRPGKL
ncbi:MAG: histidine phosphatase family protein [Acidiferrobacterales bacterium]|nr:histidine phosphatase family protein [Acidiferrobacterales bacterium]